MLYRGDTYMEIGEYIKQLRLEKGISQEELGKIVGVQRAAVQKWEAGKVQNLKRTTILALASFFNVSPIKFVSDNLDSDTTLSDHEKELVQAYRNRPDRQDSVDALLEIGNYSKEYYMAANSTNNQKHTKISLSDKKVNMIKNTKESDIDC